MNKKLPFTHGLSKQCKLLTGRKILTDYNSIITHQNHKMKRNKDPPHLITTTLLLLKII